MGLLANFLLHKILYCDASAKRGTFYEGCEVGSTRRKRVPYVARAEYTTFYKKWIKSSIGVKYADCVCGGEPGVHQGGALAGGGPYKKY